MNILQPYPIPPVPEDGPDLQTLILRERAIVSALQRVLEAHQVGAHYAARFLAHELLNDIVGEKK